MSSLTHELVSTLLASVRSVGTACTLAGVGVYLHRRGYVVGTGKRTLALISQQVTIPLLFFTKILYCNQDWSTEECPNVVESLKDVWILLIWPLYVCFMGLLVGYVCAKIAKVPKHQISSILVAVGFGNSTGLPITLLTVIHSNFPSDTNMGKVDPTMFLSIYLLLYPVLQWGIGGWLLAPPLEKSQTKKRKRLQTLPEESATNPTTITSKTVQSMKSRHGHRRKEKTTTASFFIPSNNSLAHNVLNRSDQMPPRYQILHRGLDTFDASLYMSVQENLNRYGQPIPFSRGHGSGNNSPTTDNDVLPLSDDNHTTVPLPPTFTNHEANGIMLSNTYTTTTDTNTGLHHVESTTSIGMDLSSNTNLGGGASGSNDHSSMSNNVMMDNHSLVPSSSFPLAFIQESIDSSSNDHEVTRYERTTIDIDPENRQESWSMEEKVKDNDDTMEQTPTETSALLSNGNKSSMIQTVATQQSQEDATSSSSSSFDEEEEEPRNLWTTTILQVIQRCFLQPPVVGALLGLLVASFPTLRGLFVDIVDRTGDAPLEWFFDGLYTTGQAAVPINMMILGCNLSASYMLDDVDHKDKFFSRHASMAVVIGKMCVMPCIGYVSAFLLQSIYDVPEELAGSLYLVLLIVFLCPTANNVMVMVELSGDGSKEGMARIIAYQYMVAPIILSLTVTGSVWMSTRLSSTSMSTIAPITMIGDTSHNSTNF